MGPDRRELQGYGQQWAFEAWLDELTEMDLQDAIYTWTRDGRRPGRQTLLKLAYRLNLPLVGFRHPTMNRAYSGSSWSLR